MGENGALRGRGFGPCMLAVILREEVGGMRDFDAMCEAKGISRYAEPDAEGIIEVCKTFKVLAVVLSYFCAQSNLSIAFRHLDVNKSS